MERRFTLEGGGALTVREEGLRAVLAAQRPDDGRGLYRAYLLGPEGGPALLGTMAPEGKILVIRRTISLDELRRQGAWPPCGGRAELSFSFTGNAATEGWRWADPAALPFRDGELRRAASRLGRTLYRQEGEGFALACPFSCREPFPSRTSSVWRSRRSWRDGGMSSSASTPWAGLCRPGREGAGSSPQGKNSMIDPGAALC